MRLNALLSCVLCTLLSAPCVTAIALPAAASAAAIAAREAAALPSTTTKSTSAVSSSRNSSVVAAFAADDAAYCTSYGGNLNFYYYEINNFYNTLLANRDYQTQIEPNQIITYQPTADWPDLKVIVQNKYVVNEFTFTYGQFATAVAQIFCCNGSGSGSAGQCSDGRATFSNGAGNLVVFVCNKDDQGCYE